VAGADRRFRRHSPGQRVLRQGARQGRRLFGGGLLKAAIVGIAASALSADETALLRAERPCGVILFARNIQTPAQLAALTADLRRILPDRAVLMVDQEGGRVARLRPPHWRAHPPAAALRTMRATALAVEDEWRQRLGAERLAGFRDTLITLLSDVP
jgi:hypothetical protein